MSDHDIIKLLLALVFIQSMIGLHRSSRITELAERVGLLERQNTRRHSEDLE